jgi:hypothetical protein
MMFTRENSNPRAAVPPCAKHLRQLLPTGSAADSIERNGNAPTPLLWVEG